MQFCRDYKTDLSVLVKQIDPESWWIVWFSGWLSSKPTTNRAYLGRWGAGALPVCLKISINILSVPLGKH